MLPVPTDQKELLRFALEIKEQCRASVGSRAQYCRMLNQIADTGRATGDNALINMMHAHLERAAAHLFSPVELKFNIDFENRYPKNIMDQAAVAANVLTRHWDRNNIDIMFGQGVFQALKYGACIAKYWCGLDSDVDHVTYYNKLIMPWQFAVYNETETDISKQSALCETTWMTLPEVWDRIWSLPNAAKLFEKIKSNSAPGGNGNDIGSYFHQVLSSAKLNTSGTQTTQPGGVVQMGSDPNYALVGPQVVAPMVEAHELWVQDRDDYTTILLIEPDILVSPLYKKANALGKGLRLQPYRLIQANETASYFWGRSELLDLLEPQKMLADFCDDAGRLMGLQVDKLLAFVGDSGITDEMYGQFRSAGYMNMSQGGKVEDLTPKFPQELLPWIQFLIKTINELGSFPEVMQGKGEPGVRAGVHASTLLKTASPTLRDRSLLVERQCAAHADLTMQLLEAKDQRKFWTNGESLQAIEQTQFLLTDLPEDWRVVVDSHSSSPIFANENENLIFSSFKAGIVDDEYVLDNLPYPNRDAAKLAAKERKAHKAQEMQKLLAEHPDIGEALAKKQLTGGKK